MDLIGDVLHTVWKLDSVGYELIGDVVATSDVGPAVVEVYISVPGRLLRVFESLTRALVG